jgi:acetophenone carboxylase
VWTADIDVGGTLTDGVFFGAGKVVCVKVDTTPHDLTVCLFDCLAEGATKLGFADTFEFLQQINLIRWSTTITSNVLAEGHGPRIGLIVSRGHEKDLYGAGPDRAVIGRILAETDVFALDEAVNETEIMNTARSLLERGVRRICVSLRDAHREPARETLIKRTIDQQYPDHFLGSVPVLAGADISSSSNDQTRTYCALINAYTHGALAATLFKAEDELRQTAKYAGSFLVSHVNAGVAGIAKTKAIDTIESGPIAGIHGSAFMARAQRLAGVVAMDIGGTTAKIGILQNGEPVYRKPSDFFGIPVEIWLPDLHSVALGGGSIVQPSGDSRSGVRLGPESMGSYPGPACYGLGGDQPTLTDAFVTAGLINADNFLGGRKAIDRTLAEQSIAEMVAAPLGVSTREACSITIDAAFQSVAELIARAENSLIAPDHTLFAYGGNGGLFACGVAEKARLDHAQVFSLGAVFSAFGSSVSDVCHVYERAVLSRSHSDALVAELHELVEEMKRNAIKDLLGEGLQPDDLDYSVELELLTADASPVQVRCDEEALKDLRALSTAVSRAFNLQDDSLERLTSSFDLVRLRARKTMAKPSVVESPLSTPDSSHALSSTRAIFWKGNEVEARVYNWEGLQPGNRVEGCAVLEAASTTYFIPKGWAMMIDRFGNGALSRQ